MGTNGEQRSQSVRFDDMARSVSVRVDRPEEAGVDRYVGLEHLDPDCLDISRWGSPADVEATKLLFEPGDVIYGRRRAYQRKLGVARFAGICSAHALVLRARSDVVLPQFLPFFMHTDQFHRRAIAVSVGSLSPTINWPTLAGQEFTIPTLDAQQRAVRVLEAVEDRRRGSSVCSPRRDFGRGRPSQRCSLRSIRPSSLVMQLSGSAAALQPAVERSTGEGNSHG